MLLHPYTLHPTPQPYTLPYTPTLHPTPNPTPYTPTRSVQLRQQLDGLGDSAAASVWVYTSPFSRAVQTATLAATAAGLLDHGSKSSSSSGGSSSRVQVRGVGDRAAPLQQ